MSATLSERSSTPARRPGSARLLWLKIHRWLGLTLAAFLVMAGLTGAMLAFRDPIDASLNPHLFRVQPQGAKIAPLALRERAEQLVPQARIDSVRLDDGPTDAAVFDLSPRIDPATGEDYPLEGDQLFVDPYTGEKLGIRDNATLALDRQHLVETLFMVHRYLLLGETGTKILLVVAIAWLVSTVIGFYLTFPPKGRRFFAGWKPAWRVQWSAPLPRFSFDLHRATGLWLWIMLFVISFGALRVTLGDLDLFDPMLKKVASWKDASAELARAAQKIEEPKLSWENALDLSRKLMPAAAQRAQLDVSGEASFGLNRSRGMYVYTVRSSMDVFDSGQTQLYISAVDGREIALSHPQMAGGNAFSNWTAALHRARIGGTPYKSLVTLTGFATAALAITGFIVWWKRRRPR